MHDARAWPQGAGEVQGQKRVTRHKPLRGAVYSPLYHHWARGLGPCAVGGTVVRLGRRGSKTFMGKLSLATCVRSWALAALSLATLSGATACQPDASPPQGSPPGTVARAASVEGETPNANPILTSPFRLPGT